jgi:hypothetical protein
VQIQWIIAAGLVVALAAALYRKLARKRDLEDIYLSDSGGRKTRVSYFGQAVKETPAGETVRNVITKSR